MIVVAKHSLFEGLFKVALRPSGQFYRDLKEAGFDLERPHFEYPLHVWLACLEVALRHKHPGETRSRGLQLLGKQFMDGYLATMVGRVLGAALPLLPARRYVESIPRFLEAGLGNIEVSTHWLDETHAVLTLKNLPDDSGQFLVGIVSESLTRIRARDASVEVWLSEHRAASSPSSGGQAIDGSMSWQQQRARVT